MKNIDMLEGLKENKKIRLCFRIRTYLNQNCYYKKKAEMGY